jgi:hypothetical protein
MIMPEARPCPSCQLQFATHSELTRHRREIHPPARPPALIRLTRALRAMHQEQVYAMECLLRLSQPPEADPLTWIRTRSGYHLAGRYLPARDGPASRNGRTRSRTS